MPINIFHEFPNLTLYHGGENPTKGTTVLMKMYIRLPAESETYALTVA